MPTRKTSKATEEQTPAMPTRNTTKVTVEEAPAMATRATKMTSEEKPATTRKTAKTTPKPVDTVAAPVETKPTAPLITAPKVTTKSSDTASSTRKQPRDDESEESRQTKPRASMPTADIAEVLCAPRERLESFNTDISDELDMLDREMEAEAAAAANAVTEQRLAAATDSTAAIGATDVDHVCEQLYEKMEEEAMLDILKDLQDEYIATGASLPLSNAPAVATTVSASKSEAAVKPSACNQPSESLRENLLWDVVATPAMMRAFSLTVANGAAVKAA